MPASKFALAPIANLATAVSGLLLLLPALAAAQPSLNVSFGGALDSFKPSASAVESRQNLSGTVNLEHLFAGERGRVFYDLNAGEYDSPGDWSFFEHDAGFTYRFGSGDTEARKIFLNASVTARENGDAWTNAAYSAVGAGVNAEFHPGGGTTVRAGLRSDYRRFADLSALTQFEHRAFASVLASLETRTTIVGEVQFGAKQYEGTVFSEVPAGSTTTLVAYGGQGRGPGMGPGFRVSGTPSFAIAAENGSAGLVTGLVRGAQSLTDRTGVHAQVMLRRAFGSVPPLLVTTPAGFFEDGVYDDPFASTAVFLQAGVKRVFGNDAELAATMWWTDKDYTGTEALDADGRSLPGAPLRADKVTLGHITWTQPLLASKTGAVGVAAEVGYRFLRQRSNDAFYNYTSHAVAVGLTVSY